MSETDAVVLFENEHHKNILLPDFGEGSAVQANQHLIIDHGRGAILDPGGHKVYAKVLGDTLSRLQRGSLDHILLSHQDPDIVAALNGWLMTTDATAWASQLWVRFIPHFGLDRLVMSRLNPVPDEGMFIRVGECELMLVPAHFLHSCGNHQVYDPVAKILYTGDLGASLGQSYRAVTDFDSHVHHMRGFHERYMASSVMLRAWVKMVRPLDIDIIAPQHGALFRGKPMVTKFLDWLETLECGVDRLASRMELPSR